MSDLPSGVQIILDILRERSPKQCFRAFQSAPLVWEIQGYYPACCGCAKLLQEVPTGETRYLTPLSEATAEKVTIMPHMCRACMDDFYPGSGASA